MGVKGCYKKPHAERPAETGQTLEEEGEARANKEEAVLSVETCVTTKTSAEMCHTCRKKPGKLLLADFGSRPRARARPRGGHRPARGRGSGGERAQ